MKIHLDSTSNFPRYTNSIASRTRSATKNALGLSSSVTITLNFLKKVAGINSDYAELVTLRSKSIKISNSSAEIWAVRASLLFAVYQVACANGIL